jgi:ferredoxin
VEAAAAEEDEDNDLSFGEPYIDTLLCTTCNECTNINPRLFQYNGDKQAFVADASAGSFAEVVTAAEKCPAKCIHPGKPRGDDASATPQLIERAAKFN